MLFVLVRYSHITAAAVALSPSLSECLEAEKMKERIGRCGMVRALLLLSAVWRHTAQGDVAQSLAVPAQPARLARERVSTIARAGLGLSDVVIRFRF